MHYVISDIHNDNEKFNKLLKSLNLSDHDHLFVLGDLFDRSSYHPDPVGVYFNILKLGEKCTVVRGNHDTWLADYIMNYYQTLERKRTEPAPYPYNSFELLQRRLTPVDMQDLARWILSCPVQVCLALEGEKYLMSHAMTAAPAYHKNDSYYLTGDEMDEEFLRRGIAGYISVCGHTNIGEHHIWKNALKNVYICDCGSGFRSGRLGCLCLETKEEFYV